MDEGGQEYVAEMGAFDRVTGRFGEAVNIRTPLGMLLYALYTHIEMLTPILGITETKRDDILRIAREIKDPSHKNPAAFIYGYMVLVEGSISKEKLNRIAKNLMFGVKVTDIIRYARLVISTI